jgi:microcin C transport system permease protein
MRRIGILAILAAIAAVASHFGGLALPTLRWFFSLGPGPGSETGVAWWDAHGGEVIGLVLCGLMAGAGLLMVILGPAFHANPLTRQKLRRFRSIGRGWVSFRLLMVLVVLAMLDQALVGKRALVVHHEGEWHFPAFQQRRFIEADFGGDGEAEVDFRALAGRFSEEGVGDWLLMPPIPWDPTFDTDYEQFQAIEERDGLMYAAGDGEPYSGLAYRFYVEHPDKRYRKLVFRRGLLHGPCESYTVAGEIALFEDWSKGELVSSRPTGVIPQEELESVEAGPLTRVLYPPVAPSWSRRHLLGTDSKGWDIAAQLFGGLQVVFKASVLYLAVTYAVGLTLGCLMGYFGGAFDIVVQRFVEIIANIPFLYVVMIIADRIGRENISLVTILMVMCLFSWIGMTYYMRTATYKEKARDYVAAARVLGASPARVIFRHIVPNALSTVVTLVPFSMAAITTSLTALDFLGFGLPESYPSWGRVLSDGVAHMDSPWIVGSVFGMMVFLLLLVTFVGEAVREAYDPKKFTTYK